MAKPLDEWTDAKLQALVDNYRRNGVEEGGVYPLSELLLEQRRRLVPEVPVTRVVDCILELSRKSRDGLVTYGEVHAELFPGQEWLGNASQRKMSLILDRVIGFCVEKKLPLVSVLVVRQSPRRLDPSAKTHIVSTAKSLAFDVGDSETFLQRQVEEALALARSGEDHGSD
jgi:hypothetical protein